MLKRLRDTGVPMKVLTFLPRPDLKRRVEKASFFQYDGILLDSDALLFSEVLLMIKRLRQQNADTSLFAFARYLDLEQRLDLFKAGADDCVREPFFASELAVRLGLCMRLRSAASALAASQTESVLRSGDLELDLIHRKAMRLGRDIELRPKEFLLLEYLVRNANRTVTRTMILEHVWKSSFEGLTNVVDVYISSLRSKVDGDFPQKLIQTNRGIGYTLASAGPIPRVASDPPVRNYDRATFG
jgi:two-component system OmpR family response regulator